MKNTVKTTLILGATLLMASSASAQNLIAYWAQNSNDLPGGGFGFTSSSFPQAADMGAGTITLSNFDTTTAGVDNAYTTIPSFSGTTNNALDSFPAGGSLSPQGGAETAGVFSNNGMSIDFNIDTSGFSDISISWSQRGTGSGFTSRVLSYSDNGGSTFTLFDDSDTGALGSSFATMSYDLSSVSSIDNNANVVLRLTLDGATGNTGNNRFDNIQINAATAVPEPSTYAALLGLAALGFMFLRRRVKQ